MSTQSQFSVNSARLSPELQGLFPGGVIVAEMQGPGDPALLHPDEAQFLGKSVPKRIREFSAGRVCARLAMASCGILDFALRVAPDRQPVWPNSLVGSISHTANLCVAAVAPKDRFIGVGIDCEVVDHVSADIRPTICTARELAWLEAAPPSTQAAAAALIFSAKEAFYKCQYPLTGEWLDFQDLDLELHLELTGESAGAGFVVRATRPLAIQEFIPHVMTGRYLFHDGFVTTAVCFPRLSDGVAATP